MANCYTQLMWNIFSIRAIVQIVLIVSCGEVVSPQ